MISTRTRFVPALLALGLATPLAAQEVRYGPPVEVGGGAVRTYVMVDAEGHPTELGFALPAVTLETLPPVESMDPELPFMTWDLELPEGHGTPYRFAMFDWNPVGHPPAFYEVPHFDFHLYLVDPADRDAIVTDDPAELEARGSHAPPAGYLPAHYVYPGEASVPMMGGHWIDPRSHEFHGQPFDGTFIYGTWDGKTIFMEPMVTKAHIEATDDATIEIALPQRFETPGRYPTAYRIYLDGSTGERRIALTGFQERS